MNSNEVLNREFLAMRAKILELAASLDRIERAEGDCDEAKMKLLREGIDIIAGDSGEKAVAIQMLFSRGYQDGWREEFEV